MRKDRFPTFRSAPVTFLLVLGLVLVHETAWLIGGDEGTSALARACSSRGVAEGAWWTLLASNFVHAAWDHMFLNAFGILAFGLWLETRMGTSRMALLVLISAVASSIGELSLDWSSGYGASGITFGIWGSMIGRPIWSDRNGTRRYSSIWLLFLWITVGTYVGGGDAPRVGHAAHLAGLIAGLFMAGVPWKEDPLRVPRAVRLRHAAALSLVVLGLAVAEAPRPRWTILYHWHQARVAEKAGDLERAGRHWESLIEWTDPAWDFDATYIDDAARYRLRRKDPRGALDLLVTVARTADTPKIHRDIGFLRANLDPPDMTGALEAWRNSYHTAPDQADVLDAMAQAKIYTDDSLLYRPAQAVDLARRAIEADGLEHAQYIQTLGVAYFENGAFKPALGWMRVALARADSTERAGILDDLAEMRKWVKENGADSSATGA